MPIYESECQKCGEVHTYVTRISDCTTAMPVCCGKQTKKVIITPILGFVENLDWLCPATGEYINSLKKRREVMARNDLVEAAPIEDYKPPTMPELTTEEILASEQQFFTNQ